MKSYDFPAIKTLPLLFDFVFLISNLKNAELKAKKRCDLIFEVASLDKAVCELIIQH